LQCDQWKGDYLGCREGDYGRVWSWVGISSSVGRGGGAAWLDFGFRVAVLWGGSALYQRLACVGGGNMESIVVGMC